MNEIDEMILEDRRADRTRIEAEYDEYVNREDDRHICTGSAFTVKRRFTKTMKNMSSTKKKRRAFARIV